MTHAVSKIILICWFGAQETFLIIMSVEWMNEWCIYIALYYVLLYTQSTLQSCLSLSTTTSVQHPLDDATAATGQRRQCAHHTPATGGEERVIEPISVKGLLGGHGWQGPVVGIWPGHWGYTPTLYEMCHGIFNDHRESGPRLMSHPKDFE